MKKKSKKQQTKDILKVLKAENRAAEIKEHGRPLRISTLTRNKKLYTRKLKHKRNEDNSL